MTMAGPSTQKIIYDREDSSDMDVSSGEEDLVIVKDPVHRNPASKKSLHGNGGVDLSARALAKELRQHVREHYSHQSPIQPKVECFLLSQSTEQASQNGCSGNKGKESYAAAARREKQNEPIVISDDENDDQNDRFYTPPSSPLLKGISDMPLLSSAQPAAPSNSVESSSAAYFRAKKAQQEVERLRQQLHEQSAENSKYKQLLNTQQKQQKEMEKQLATLKKQSDAAGKKLNEAYEEFAMAENTLKNLKTTLLRMEVNLSLKKNQKKARSSKSGKAAKTVKTAPSPIKKPNTKMTKSDMLRSKNASKLHSQQQQQSSKRKHQQSPSSKRKQLTSEQKEEITSGFVDWAVSTFGHPDINTPEALQSYMKGEHESSDVVYAQASRQPSTSMTQFFLTQPSASQSHYSQQRASSSNNVQANKQYLSNAPSTPFRGNNRYINRDVINIQSPQTSKTSASTVKKSHSAVEVSSSQAQQGNLPIEPVEIFDGDDIDSKMEEEGVERAVAEEGEIVENEQKPVEKDRKKERTQQPPHAQGSSGPPAPAHSSSTAFRPYRPALSSLGVRAADTLPAPQRALCPAESSGGVCRDSSCTYAHFSDYQK